MLKFHVIWIFILCIFNAYSQGWVDKGEYQEMHLPFGNKLKDMKYDSTQNLIWALCETKLYKIDSQSGRYVDSANVEADFISSDIRTFCKFIHIESRDNDYIINNYECKVISAINYTELFTIPVANNEHHYGYANIDYKATSLDFVQADSLLNVNLFHSVWYNAARSNRYTYKGEFFKIKNNEVIPWFTGNIRKYLVLPFASVALINYEEDYYDDMGGFGYDNKSNSLIIKKDSLELNLYEEKYHYEIGFDDEDSTNDDHYFDAIKTFTVLNNNKTAIAFSDYNNIFYFDLEKAELTRTIPDTKMKIEYVDNTIFDNYLLVYGDNGINFFSVITNEYVHKVTKEHNFFIFTQNKKEAEYFAAGYPDRIIKFKFKSTDISEQQGDDINLYPIPARNVLNISSKDGKLDEAEIVIRDLHGGIVIKEKGILPQIAVELKNIPSGVYQLSIMTKNKIITKGIAIIH